MKEKIGLSMMRRMDVSHKNPRAHWRLVRLNPLTVGVGPLPSCVMVVVPLVAIVAASKRKRGACDCTWDGAVTEE